MAWTKWKAHIITDAGDEIYLEYYDRNFVGGLLDPDEYQQELKVLKVNGEQVIDDGDLEDTLTRLLNDDDILRLYASAKPDPEPEGED